MKRRHGLPFWLVIGGVPLCCVCSDSPSSPAMEEAWSTVAIENAPALGGFQSLAFAENNALAVGTGSDVAGPSASYTPLVAGATGTEGWQRVTLAGLPNSGFLTAVGFAASGDAIIAGADLDAVPFVQGFILDQRLGWNRLEVPLVGMAIALSGAILRTAGSGSESVLVSSIADTWTAEPVPFPPGTISERGLADVAAGNGVFAACGFDDGGDGSPEAPNEVLFVHQGSGWQRIDTPCDGCSNREFRAVAVGTNGTILLGGAITDFSGGAPDDYVAFLLERSPSGVWLEVVLPQAGKLDRVNDILIAASGTYLACGLGQTSYIVRVPPGSGPVLDTTLQDARVECLAEDAGGLVWAGGSRGSDPNLPTPAIWKRRR